MYNIENWSHDIGYKKPKLEDLKALTRSICLTIKASWVSDHLLYSGNLHVWFRSVTERREIMLVSLRCQKVNMLCVWTCSSEVQTLSKDQLRHMEGTVILHITFAVKQDQDLGKEFIKYLKVFSSSSWANGFHKGLPLFFFNVFVLIFFSEIF